jgi:hypothetical protein
MKRDPRTIVNVNEDHTFVKPEKIVTPRTLDKAYAFQWKPDKLDVRKMKKDPLTIVVDTSQDHTFNKPASKIIRATSIEKMDHLYIGRGDARLPIYVMTKPNTIATVILLPGNVASFGQIVHGKPTSIDFLSRSRDYFFNEDFNVIIVYRASDINSLNFAYNYRLTNHVDEVARVVEFANQKFKKPVWLIGASRGTISGVSTSIALDNKKVKGLVLTSTVTSQDIGNSAILAQPINKIKIPVLMVHHSTDTCRFCNPIEASNIISNFTSSPIKKFMLINGGSDPSGDPCWPLHWHGFINYEKETVKLISDWIKNPHA